MRLLDQLLQRWRYHKAVVWIEDDCLDVGSYDGSLLALLPEGEHIALDSQNRVQGRCQHVRDWSELPPSKKFSSITCLATYEHFSLEQGRHFWNKVSEHLAHNGKLIMTIPHPLVDQILEQLTRLNLLSGIDHLRHRTVTNQELLLNSQSVGLCCIHYEEFMAGLNRLIVFERNSSKKRPSEEGR